MVRRGEGASNNHSFVAYLLILRPFTLTKCLERKAINAAVHPSHHTLNLSTPTHALEGCLQEEIAGIGAAKAHVLRASGLIRGVRGCLYLHGRRKIRFREPPHLQITVEGGLAMTRRSKLLHRNTIRSSV